MPSSRSALVTFASLSLVSCDPGIDAAATTPQPAFESRDSAGIAIVTVVSPPSDAAEWRLSTSPRLEIGTVDGNPAMQFYQVVGGSLLPDGRIVVANRSTSELRFFDPTGAHVLSVGGSGGGPGEFRDLQHLQLINDSLHVYDGRRRISVFDDAGRYVRAVEIGTPPTLWQYVGRFGTGARVFGGVDPETGVPAPGIGRDRYVYLMVSPDGSPGAALASVDGPERSIQREEGPDGRARTSFVTIAFSAYPRLAVLHDHLVIGAGNLYELRFLSPGGTLERIVRWPRPPVNVTDADVRILAEESDALRQDLHAEVFPAHGPLLTDRAGNLWVSDYRRPGEEDIEWNIFDEHGAWRGSARIPADLRILEIGESHLLGVWRNTVGVEYVRLYGLARPV